MEKVIVDNIVRSCPKAFASLIEWFKGKGDFSNYPLGEEASIEPLQRMIMVNSVPRYLYDFFDHHRIYLKVCPEGSETDWSWSVLDHAVQTIEEGSAKLTRPNAEDAAFEMAFKVLENRL